jgi:hypothetical protein
MERARWGSGVERRFLLHSHNPKSFILFYMRRTEQVVSRSLSDGDDFKFRSWYLFPKKNAPETGSLLAPLALHPPDVQLLLCVVR